MYYIAAILIIPYLCLLLEIYRGLTKLKTFNRENYDNLFVSIIVACRNEQENLPSLLNSIAAQNYPGDLFEVIIADDNSTDRTFDIASGFTAIKNLTVKKNEGNGKKDAVRTGFFASSGSLIVTTDADCIMGKEWLGTIVSFYQKTKADMIVCPVQISPEKGFFGRFQELEFLSLQGITAGSILSGKETMCNGANLAFTREAYLNNMQKLKPGLVTGDDVFLLHSLKKNPLSKIEWLESGDAIVTTCSLPAAGKYLKQRKRWISKAWAYDDRYTILLGIVTFVTILLQLSALAAGFTNITFIYVYLLILFLKSIPDLLILINTTRRYGKSDLMIWFIPSQIVYPFYVLITALYAVTSPPKQHN